MTSADLALPDPFAPDLMLRYRLRPMACIHDGFIVWCRQEFARPDHPASLTTLAISQPRRPVGPPFGTEIACLSIGDYRRVTSAIAAAEEA